MWAMVKELVSLLSETELLPSRPWQRLYLFDRA
jgi:hypothetical protein